jgi:hypothetical protein
MLLISFRKNSDSLECFALSRPPAKLLQELRNLVAVSVTGGVNPRGKTIFEYCLDIAAACTTHYPFGLQERVMAKEKKLLEKLFQAFRIDAEAILATHSGAAET